MTHPLTDEMCEQITDELSIFSIEDCMRTAYDKGAEDRLEQVIEWISTNLMETYLYADYSGAYMKEEEFLEDLKKAMRPQENNS